MVKIQRGFVVSWNQTNVLAKLCENGIRNVKNFFFSQMKRWTALIGGIMLLIVACAAPAQPEPTPTLAAVTTTAAAQPTLPPPATSPAAAAVESTLPAPTAVAVPTSLPAATEAAPALATLDMSQVIFTPSQAEGPYYPVGKPDDLDNNLVQVAGAAGQAQGETLLLAGKLYDAAGAPVAGAVIEIWQTDAAGIYLHPNDPGLANRDPHFQGYGEAVTAADGSYWFLTLLPGTYENRPRHIHVKVKMNGQELLTTQFYFAEDVLTSGDALARGAGDALAALLVEVTAGTDDAGNPLLLGQRDVILSSYR